MTRFVGEVALASNGDKSASNSFATTLSETVPAGDLLVFIGARDDKASEASIPAGETFSDASGHTWVRGTQGINITDSTAGNGVRFVLFAAVLTADLESGDAVTWSFAGGGTVAAKCMHAYRFEGVRGVDTGFTPTAGTSSSPSITTTSLGVGGLLVALVAREGPAGDTFTADADTTGGAWSSAYLSTGTTGGAADSNVSFGMQYKIVEGSGAQTFNPTITSRDWVAYAVHFFPAPLWSISQVGW